jgi:hypothetical protein
MFFVLQTSSVSLIPWLKCTEYKKFNVNNYRLIYIVYYWNVYTYKQKMSTVVSKHYFDRKRCVNHKIAIYSLFFLIHKDI